MARWRSPELETRFAGPLDKSGLTLPALERLVMHAEPENEQLEYKQPAAYSRTSGPKDDWTREQEFAKDVCALANHRGGLLLIGMRERQGAAAGLVPVDSEDEPFHVLDQRLRLALVNNSAPAPLVDIIDVLVTDTSYCVAVVVPPSPRAPHAVVGETKGRLALRYPVRDGSDTRWLGEPEVAVRYRARQAGEAATRTTLGAVVARGKESLGRGEGFWVYLALSPGVVAPGQMSASFMAQVDAWLGTRPGRSPFGSLDLTGARPIAGPGSVTYTGPAWREGEDETDPRESYLAVYADGSVFAALSPVADGSAPGVGENSLVDALIALTNVTTNWTTRQSGAWGSGLLAGGLFQSDLADSSLSPPLPLLTANSGHLTRRRRTRTLTRDPAVQLSVDLAGASAHQGRLATAWQVASSMFQHFGLPETTQLNSEGALRPSHWGSRYQQNVESWAAAFEIPTVR